MTGASIRLKSHIEPGAALVWGQLTAEPFSLTETLAAQAGELGGVRAFVGMSVQKVFEPDALAHIDFSFAGGAATNGRLAVDGALNTLPVHLSQIPGFLADGRIACDVALVHGAANADGGLNLALSADYMGDAAAVAPTVIAEVNAALPRTFGDTDIDAGRISARIETDRPPAIFESPPIGDVERAIGGHVAHFVPDRATIQMGVGSLPDAALAALAGRKDLGIHTGLMSDAALRLIEAGTVTNRYKGIDPGRTVTAILYGSQDLYRWAHENDDLRIRSVRHTHNQDVLGQVERLVAINAALEVDLTGQVNGEMAGDRPMGLVGGQVDFGRAAMRSPGGRSIIALRSTARGGTVSSIVPGLSRGIVTTARTDVDVVVTEHGAAELAGVPVFERARRLIAIAHPDFRKSLTKASDRLA